MNDLNAWFKDRPRWIQEAASLFLTKGCLAEGDIVALLDPNHPQATAFVNWIRSLLA